MRTYVCISGHGTLMKQVFFNIERTHVLAVLLATAMSSAEIKCLHSREHNHVKMLNEIKFPELHDLKL